MNKFFRPADARYKGILRYWVSELRYHEISVYLRFFENLPIKFPFLLFAKGLFHLLLGSVIQISLFSLNVNPIYTL